MRKTPKILLLLYLLLGYVIAQFLWWAYSIYNLNAELSILNQEILRFQGKEIMNVPDSLKGKLYMILGEGTVFLTLLLVGAAYIRRFILREQKLARQERNFLLATTHEFNSPIAAIKLNLQTLAKREVTSEQKATLLQGALSSTQRLELLVTNLLMAARLDAGKLELLKEMVSIDQVFEQLMSRYTPLALDANCSLHFDHSTSISLELDRHALEIVFGNLIENAIKYAAGTEINVSCSTRNEEVVFRVTDRGRGIPKSERINVFRKFYRIENEETRSQKGSGLGLYLVKELVELHGGKIAVGDHSPHGTEFIIIFSTHK